MAHARQRRSGAHFSPSGQRGPAPVRPARAPRPHARPQGAASSPQARPRARVALPAMAAVRPRTKAQRIAAARGNHSHRGTIAGVILGVAVLAVAFVVLALPRIMSSEEGLPNEGETVQVVIPEGSGALAMGKILQDAGVISSADDFVSEARRTKSDSSLKGGAYSLTVGQGIDSIIDQLKLGPNSTSSSVTVPEGLTVAQTAATVEKALSIPADDFIAQAKASNYASSYPFLADVANDSLEGFLCPKTYDFSGRGTVTADMVIRAMLDQYQAEVASLDFTASRASVKARYDVELSDYDFVKLASVVEREGLNATQRAHVAAVFYNRLGGRLAQGRYLQSDATMMYVTGGEVTAEDLKIQSPYNTYLNEGLPPTPICSPSLESLCATLEPADSNDLYFYITADSEWFSETYDQHMQAISPNG